MSKKMWQALVDQNMVTIERLTAVTDEMVTANRQLNFPKWDKLNRERCALLDDLNCEVMAAYHAVPVKSVARRGKDNFWKEVNRIVNG